MKKRRRILRVEQLEARDTPDVSMCAAAACPMPDGAAVLDGAADTAGPSGTLTTDENFSLHALESIFSNSTEMEKLLADSVQLFPQADTPVTTTVCPDAGPESWQFVCNYARKAVRNDELRYGQLGDHEDAVQQILLEWREQTGPDQQSLANVVEKDSPQRLLLRKTVRRVLDHVRYEQNRQLRTVELIDQPAPTNAAEEDWRELQLDWSVGPFATSVRERQLLELRRQGMTFEEIGTEMGMAKQRVCEVYNAVIARLQQVYS